MKELTLDERKAIMLDIMSDIDDFCRSNGIRYSISSGTLLGAVRHGGFIPWDDDADMFMLREDFDRFVKEYKNRKYDLLFNTHTEESYLASGFAKVCDPNTVAETKTSLTKYGVFVDVFPLDSVPEDKKDRKKYMHRVMHYHNRLHHRQKKDLLSILKSYSHSVEWWWNKCDREVHSGKYNTSPLVGHILGTQNDRTVLNRDRFDEMTEIVFEGRSFKALKDIHSYLVMVYGEDYMTPPPVSKRKMHNAKIFKK